MMMVAFQFLMQSLDQECAHKLSTLSLIWIILLFHFIYKNVTYRQSNSFAFVIRQ